MVNTNEHERRHREVYATPGLPAFNADWVTDRVMAGRQPLTVCDVQWLVAQGVTHILDLRESHEWSAPRFGAEAVAEIERAGLHRLHLQVVDMSAPTAQSLDEACRFLDEALSDSKACVYVHCRAGMERTAAVLVAYYARQQGVSYEQALGDLRKKRPIFSPLRAQECAVRAWLAQASNP